jgi:MFS family permease
MPRVFPASVARARGHAGRFPRTFWVLLAGEAVASLGFGLVVPYFALFLTSEVGIAPATAGAVVAVWAVIAVPAQPLGGVLADRLGRRPVMLVGLAGGGLAAVGFAFATEIWQVVVLTAVWALCNGIFEPAVGAYLADVSPHDLLTEAFGLQRVASNAFFAIGPPLGALVIWLSSLRATFFLAGVAIVAYLAIVWRGLPESLPERGEGEPPARIREALRDRLLVLLALGTGAATLAYAFYEDALPVFLHEERGIAVATWGLVFGLNPLCVAFLQYPLARWAARRSSRLVLATGSVLQGLAFLLLVPLTGIGGLVVAGLVLTAGEMLVAPVASAVAADLAPERLRGSYQGVLNLAWEGAWGPAAFGGLWLVGHGHGELMLVLGLPLGAVGALAYLALPGGPLHSEPGLVSAEPMRP